MNLRDLTTVDWLYVVVLAALVFVAALIGNLLSFGHRVRAAAIGAMVFAGLFVLWTYYPHRLPLPTAIKVPKPETPPAAPPATAPPPVPAAPPNPIKDITPPMAPAR